MKKLKYFNFGSVLKNITQSNIKLWHIIVVLVIMIVSRNLPTEAAAPFLTGNIFIASSTNTTPFSLTIGQPEATHISTSFNVPSGSVADLAAFYNTRYELDSSGSCNAEIRIDSPTGPIVSAGESYLGGGANDYGTQSLNGVATNISAGDHTIYVTVEPESTPYTGDPACTLAQASLILLVRTH